jgi:hypothetical protein
LSNTQQFKLTQQLKPTDPFDFTSSFGLTLQKKAWFFLAIRLLLASKSQKTLVFSSY